MARRIIIAALALAVANAAILLIRNAWLLPVRVGSDSMQPALNANDRLLVDRTVDLAEIERGDIVVAEVDGERLVKRVIGLPSETIQGGEQVVAVDGDERLEERWANWGDDRSRFGPVQLSDSEIWLMGDNRNHSDDSRSFGPVDFDAVAGRVAWRFWPADRLGRP